MHIAICDDEKNLLDDLKRMIENQCADCYADIFTSGEELISASKDYDIYFLDIQMAGMSGIETAEQIRKKEKQAEQPGSIIIFITSHADYWPEAFDVQAYHYLVKPVDKQKFAAVFASALKDCLKKKANAKKHIIIKSKDKHHKILLRDILYIESQNRKVIANTTKGTIDHYGKMQDFAENIGETFYRSHRCYIVNMEHISSYNAAEIRLADGSCVPLAHKKYNEFVRTYMHYAKRGGLVSE